MTDSKTPAKGVSFSLSQELRFYVQHFHYVHFILLVAPGFLLLREIPRVALTPCTASFSVIYYYICSMAITAGYHRLWCHRSYRASRPLRYVLAALGAGQLQWSILWWTRHHRAHHRYLDTDKDPYNARRGLFYSHMGWLIGYTPETWGSVNISDVERDPVVIWQRRYYVVLAVLTGFILPATVAHVGWHDWDGGLWYAGLLRGYLHAHMTFLVNSVAHHTGSQPYSTSQTARDNALVALITSGEGYHNFHHRFPSDYRNGRRWYDFDPSKWLIWTCEKLGLAWELTATSEEEIERVIVSVKHRTLRKGNSDKFVVDDHDMRELHATGHGLPSMTWDDFQQQTSTGRCLISIAGQICDVTDFIHSHPGGSDVLQNAIGKDATDLFSSSKHSTNAHRLLLSMRVAVIGTSSAFKVE
ncbi:hypothetical protein BDV34DRAFT_234752 [Aspergillus parasiticus]|uniref:Acyl-CoA desaturase n=1 Tax=Aspergillus parasiticus TaxID=5067 RepID=A0A5N6E3F3_ASPPA|nr:hypothetical protein BDV34DRAFT_234752 [Aspergillus parasiticus]